MKLAKNNLKDIFEIKISFKLMNINILIKIQKKFRLNRNKIKKMNNKLSLLRNILMSMINNLIYCNNLQLLNNNIYLSILFELKEIKLIADSIPHTITFKNRKENVFKLFKYEHLLIKYINHISPENIQIIFKLFYDKDCYNLFNNNDLEKIIVISHFFRPLCVWVSDKHTEEIKINTDNFSNNTIITKNLTDMILNIKKNDNLSLVLHEPSSFLLKQISDIITVSPKNASSTRTLHFDINNCIDILNKNKIKIMKNKITMSLGEDKNGAIIHININDRYFVFQGVFKEDLLNFSSSYIFIKNQINKIKALLNNSSIPKIFKDNYFKYINLRDLLILSSEEIIDDIIKKHNDFKILQNKTLITLVNEFLLASKYRKNDILTLLLSSDDNNRKIACVLFDILKNKDKNNLANELYNSLHSTIRDILDTSKKQMEKEENEILKISESDISYERRINMMNVSNDVKLKAGEKLKLIRTSQQGDSKAEHWLDGFLNIPFNIYKENKIIAFKNNFRKKINENNNISLFSDNDINNYVNMIQNDDNIKEEWNDYQNEKKDYLSNVRKILDDAVYGHKDAKLQLERLFAQWINGESKGAVLGLQGPPGTGKTSLAKNGLSKCLLDYDNKPRPFVMLPIGGSVNGSTLVGHNFTYVSSSWGRIVDILITTKCMNPIIFIDEIDKVSHTEHGKEIISILTHITDSTQNDEFEDKYFSGIKIDLSKALIVFSFNDPNLIDPILRDRITIIETHPLKINEKLTIIKDYIIPQICKDVGFNKSELIFTDELIIDLIETYTNEAGVRKIKEKIVDIIRDINLKRFYFNDIVLPYTITKEYVKNLFENHLKVRIKKISPQPLVGTVNGLYASSNGGLGGITLIQAIKFPSTKMLELNLTGQAGDVMKESSQYALKNAFALLSPKEQSIIIKKPFGIHIHCPDGATPKDGPSAGLAFTLAIYSILTNTKVRNDVCMTGEIDLLGNAGIIGGLHAKLHGGKKAGCKIALIPQDNMEDLEKMRNENTSPEDETFKVIPVNNINDIIKIAIIC